MSTTAVRMPRQVREQAKRADEELKKLSAAQTPPEPTPEAPPAEPSPTPETSEPAQPAEPQAPNQPEPTVESLRSELARAEHRNSTLMGINEAQTRELRQIKERLGKLETPAPATPPVDPNRAKKHLTDEEKTTLSQETIDTTARIARSEVDPVVERVNAVESRMNDRLHRLFLSELATKHPESTTLNTDPDWLLWLGNVDAKTRVPRQELLDRAVAAQDVEQTWAFFEEFLRDSGKTPAPTPSPPVRTTPKAPAPKPAPVAAAPQPTAPAQKRRFNLSYVKKFMKDRAIEAGKGIAMTTELKQIDREIALAEQEGRIDMNR